MESVNATPQDKAKTYACLKYSLSIFETIYVLTLLFLFAGSGASKMLSLALARLTQSNYLMLPAYLFATIAAYYLLNLPLNFYHSFVLEHRFSLSRQKIKDWLMDQLKGLALSYVLSLICLEVFYFILARYPGNWWLIVSIAWIFFSLILAKLTPVLIVPLFFKYKRLTDELLRQRVLELANLMRVKVLDVFEIDFSKKSLKANAAFIGWGATRRVLLADTLKDTYTQDEMQVILAHEFAHFRLKHLLKLILISAGATVLSFLFIFKTSAHVLHWFHVPALSDLAALPVILIYFIAAGIALGPLENYISRSFEREADAMAIKVTGLKDQFVATMDKLAAQNLADRKPHPVIKFFFFDHPPIDERIEYARALGAA